MSDSKGRIVYPQWLLFGDSITQHSFMPGGLGQSLADAYQRRLDIVKRGYGGYNTEWGLHVAPHVLPKTLSGEAPLTALNIWWGANDATLPIRTQSLPIERFKANLRSMVDLLRSENSPHYSPSTEIIILSCPPVAIAQRAEDVERKWGPGIPLDREAERTKQFADAAQEVALESKTGFVDVFGEIMRAAGPDPEEGLRKYLSDGLHLNSDGYQVVYQALTKVVERDFPDLAVEKVPRLFPDWSTIDPTNPGASFPPLP